MTGVNGEGYGEGVGAGVGDEGSVEGTSEEACEACARCRTLGRISKPGEAAPMPIEKPRGRQATASVRERASAS